MRFRAIWIVVYALGLLLTFGVGAPRAEGLRVFPVTLDVTAPAAATALTVTNDGTLPMTVQARMFHWRQSVKGESLTPTRAVVASPPMFRLAPGARQTIRIVRTIRSAVHGEEAYRIFVDEVPDLSHRRNGTIEFVTRVRIPVFFYPQARTVPGVRWTLQHRGNRTVLTATNTGGTHLRIADLQLLRGNHVVFRHGGLVGYVLAGSTMQWLLQKRIVGHVILQAATNEGPYRASVERR